MNHNYFVLIPVLAITAACAFSGSGTIFDIASATPSPSISPSHTATIPTKTLTPVPPTSTTIRTATASATLTPTATITLTPALPGVRFPETPVRVPLPYAYLEGQTRILLIGVDSRDPRALRVDALLLLSLNSIQGTANLLSIPPGLYVQIPEVGMERLSSSVVFGGYGKVIDTIEYNLGVRPDRYVAVDYQNFAQILESVQPINVSVVAKLVTRCDIPGSTSGWCSVKPGIQSMNAAMALWYVRDTSGGDTDRMRRSQEVLLALFQKLMEEQAPSRIDELYAAYQSKVETDLTVEDLFNLSPVGFNLFSTRQIKTFSFSPLEAVPATLPGGENVLLLDQNAAWNLILRSVFTP